MRITKVLVGAGGTIIVVLCGTVIHRIIEGAKVVRDSTAARMG